MMSSLIQMDHAQSGTIVKIRGKPELHRRLLKAGLAIGTIVESYRQTSSSNLVVINVLDHSSILLEKQVVANIFIETK